MSSIGATPADGRPIGLGVIGCGNVLSAYASTTEKLCARGEVRWVIACGREHQKERVMRQLRPERFTTEVRDVIAAADVEVVLILTSMQSHAELARACLRAGKHVLVEKPFASTLEDGAALLALARTQQRHLFCAPFTVLSPTFQTISRRIQSGQIGRPCSARARYGWAGPDWSDWFYRPGGGCLFDVGVYCLTSLTGLLGPVQRVTAFTSVALPERTVGGRTLRVEAEDNAQVLLDFGGGLLGVVTAGFTLQQYRGPALEIYGTTGTVQMLGDDWDPDGFELWQNEVGAWQVFKETAPDWPWTDGLNHLLLCLRTGQVPWVTPEHALHVLEVMVQAQESSRTGRALSLNTSFVRPEFAAIEPAEAVHRQHDRTREH